MGVNTKSDKKRRKRYELTEEEKIERDLRSCMRCRYFYGSKFQCPKQECCKEEPQAKPKLELPSECAGCPYRKGDIVCFPCMMKLLGYNKVSAIQD